MTQHYLGIDVGGSSVKAAVVDVSSGQLCSAVSRWETPHPATPDALIAGFATLAQALPAAGRIGLAMPCVVQQGRTRTAANIDVTARNKIGKVHPARVNQLGRNV